MKGKSESNFPKYKFFKLQINKILLCAQDTSSTQMNKLKKAEVGLGSSYRCFWIPKMILNQGTAIMYRNIYQ